MRENDFSLNGLMGYNFYQKTAGIIGTGRIGAAMARICQGFGMRVAGYDTYQNPDLDFVEYLPLDQLLEQSDLISLHCPLTEETYHMINSRTIRKMKDGVVLVNTLPGRTGEDGGSDRRHPRPENFTPWVWMCMRRRRRMFMKTGPMKYWSIL